MRQRFLKSGLESFADHEALELLLYYAIPRRDTNPIAHRLMERYGSLTAVLSAPAEDLKKVEGIGESAAVLLKIAGQIGRKARLSDTTQSRAMTDVETVGAYLLEKPSGTVLGLQDAQNELAKQTSGEDYSGDWGERHDEQLTDSTAQQTSGEPEAEPEAAPQAAPYTELPLDAEGYPVE